LITLIWGEQEIEVAIPQDIVEYLGRCVEENEAEYRSEIEADPPGHLDARDGLALIARTFKFLESLTDKPTTTTDNNNLS
jgi:hypothetical protein